MEEYKVGQILFLIGKKSMKIMPIQIVEEVIRTTIAGKEKTYTVEMPNQKATRVDIKDVTGTLFSSKQLLRAHMLQNATNAIDTMITNAAEIADEKFDAPPPEPFVEVVENKFIQPKIEQPNDVQFRGDDDIIRVDLGDGKIGNVNIGKISGLESK